VARKSGVPADDRLARTDPSEIFIMRTPQLRGLSARLVIIAGLFGALAGPGLAQDQTPAPERSPDAVVATVNGVPVTEADLEQALADLDPQFARLPPERRRAAALSAIIEIRLLAARAVEEKLDQTPEFQRRMDFLRSRTLHTALVEADVARKITDDEIRARYDQEVANTPPSNEVKARHILVKTKEEAEDIVRQLDGGADFATLASEKTDDPSGKSSGGDLGWFGAGQMVPEFETAAFALNVGEHSKEPVQSQFGWHVIKVEDKRVQQPPAFDQVKDQVRSLLFREKYFALAKSLRDAATVEVADPELQKGLDQIERSQ
jgi:peptidyl-prolyl cis-trans isomerase C